MIWSYHKARYFLSDRDIPILKQAKAEYAKRVLSSALSRRVKVPLALK